MVTKTLELWIGHVSKETWSRLDDMDDIPSVYVVSDFNGGFILCALHDDNSFLPEDLRQCMTFAKDRGCKWLFLDPDPSDTTYDLLPTYSH